MLLGVEAAGPVPEAEVAWRAGVSATVAMGLSFFAKTRALQRRR
jgi:hypothetical protein